jgi:hypothetical protein
VGYGWRAAAPAAAPAQAAASAQRGLGRKASAPGSATGSMAWASSKRFFASSVRARASACTSSSLTRLAMLDSTRSSTARKRASEDVASVLRDSSRLCGASDEADDEADDELRG